MNSGFYLHSSIILSLNVQKMAATVIITATIQVTNWAQNYADYQAYFNVHKGQIRSRWSNYMTSKLCVCINSFLFTVREWQNKVTKLGPGAYHLPCHQAGLAQGYLPVSQSSFHFFFCHGYTKRETANWQRLMFSWDFNKPTVYSHSSTPHTLILETSYAWLTQVYELFFYTKSNSLTLTGKLGIVWIYTYFHTHKYI